MTTQSSENCVQHLFHEKTDRPSRSIIILSDNVRVAQLHVKTTYTVRHVNAKSPPLSSAPLPIGRAPPSITDDKPEQILFIYLLGRRWTGIAIPNRYSSRRGVGPLAICEVICDVVVQQQSKSYIGVQYSWTGRGRLFYHGLIP